MTLSDGLYCANHEIVRSDDRKSEEQDKHAGDHQREHPDQIDVEPRAAQYRDAKFFVNHNRDQRSRYKIPQGVDYDRRDEQRRRAKIRECPRVHLVTVMVMRLSRSRRWQKKRDEHQSCAVR